MNNLRTKVYEAHRLLSEKNESITAGAIRNKITGKSEKTYMLMEIFEEHNQKMAALVGKEFSHGTLERYETSFKHTQAMIRFQ